MTPPNTAENQPAAAAAKPARRWLKIAASAGAGLVALALALTAALWIWAGTDGSLATVLLWISRSQPLAAEHATGSLRAGGHIDQLRWRQNGLTVDARDVSLAWQPWSLLHGTLKLDRLAAASVRVADQRAPAATPSPPPETLRLPLPVTLDEFSVGLLHWAGAAAFTASDISGRYEYAGAQHRLDLKSVQVASGRYSARAVLTSAAPLTLDASLAGALGVDLPGGGKPVPLAFQATAHGPLTDLRIKAELQMAQARATDAAKAPRQPHASVTARVMPWAAQPLPQADATFRDLDIAALWPDAAQTLLTGSAAVQPLDKPNADAAGAWALQLRLTNALPGPWDQKRLPIEQLDSQGEWRNGAALVRSLKAQLGSGELLASGEWAGNSPAGQAVKTGKPAPAPAAWKVTATLKHVNPARLHSKLAPLPLDGQAEVHGQGASTSFDANVQTARHTGDPASKPKSRVPSSEIEFLQQLDLQSASATGSWNALQAGGTLALSALRVRTGDAELSGQLEVQPAAKGGKGTLALTAPGLDAKLDGELRQSSGGGALTLQNRDAAQALRWLQKLPGMPAALLDASASGGAGLQASWQGGWQDPALQARLDVASLDWQTGTLTTKSAASPTLLKIRALQAMLSGRLSQAQLSAQGQVEADQRRYALRLEADGGQLKRAGASGWTLAGSGWRGSVGQFNLGVEDTALGSGAWRLATRGPVRLQWTPDSSGAGMLESGGGEAVLTAPPAKGAATAATPSQATLAWRPVRWRPGELVSAGKITGLPLAWLELIAGPQFADAGLGGNLVFDGQWDAVLADTLTLKASLARSSGDISVQAEGLEGNPARLAAGVKQASATLEGTGGALSLAVRWDSERAGAADGQVSTRLARAPAGAGVAGWVWPADAPLDGRIHARLPRIGVWSLLAPPGWRIRGSLGADIAISGTRAAPNLAGELRADDLALRSVVDGIEFGNGRLRARLDGGTRLRIDEFTLQGAGDKGAGGTLTARGDAGWVDGKPQVLLDATLRGLRASIRTDRQLTVSGAVQASLRGGQAELSGKLAVDQARIVLPDENTPALGNDVIVRTSRGAAAGPKAPEKTSAQAADKAASPALKLSMLIDLGGDFRVQGKGIDTRLRGALTLTGDSPRGPRLTGVVTTSEGQYRAYGQRLDIERGVLRFTGAIDNPSLDILAIRPNLTQRVGVQITGTALLPSVRLYAQPELPDAEKLSWLVVGRAAAAGGAEAALLQQAALALLGSKAGGLSGGLAASLGLDELSFRGAASNADGSASDSAVTLGKRFSRNFYAAYERSISGTLGTLYVFYDLSQRFTLRAQAGQQSAVDLIFTVSYD